MNHISSLSTLVVAACLGCGGPDATVQGIVTIDGELVDQGTVQFHPVDGGPTAYGSIAKNGSYALRVGQGDRGDPDGGLIHSGEYIVTAVVNMPPAKDETLGEAGPPVPGARLSAEKYGSKELSDLRATVKVGANIVPLELERATVEEEVDVVVDAPEDGAIESAPDSSQPLDSQPSTAGAGEDSP